MATFEWMQRCQFTSDVILGLFPRICQRIDVIRRGWILGTGPRMTSSECSPFTTDLKGIGACPDIQTGQLWDKPESNGGDVFNCTNTPISDLTPP